ncbi:MAG: hypothetical protein K9J17_11295 [Flavobacteriales bacterium]|nr:hypothetical protein [Flavobacteriales bacterium]
MKPHFRKLTLVLVFSFFVTGVYAMKGCGPYGLKILPEGDNINPNSWIIVEGSGVTEKIVLSLDEKYPVYLESIGHTVKMLVKEVRKGNSTRTQTVLIPEHSLFPGQTYELRIMNLSEAEERMIWQNRKGEVGKWKVVQMNQVAYPKWKAMPHLKNTESEFNGSIRGTYATFTTLVETSIETLVETKLLDLTDAIAYSYYLPLEGDTLSVGNDGCSGSFNYDLGHQYQIQFRLVDINGYKDENWTEPITFESPVKEL